MRVSLVKDHQPGPTVVLGWSVPDINSTVRNMSARGVTFERDDQLDQDEWGVWQAMDGSQEARFKDPDGNVLCLTQA
jgi:hypothetical protein